MIVNSGFRCLAEGRLFRPGIASALIASMLGLLPSMLAQTSPCDLNQDGVTNAADVTLAINMALGTSQCLANVEGSHICTVITVQRVFNAYNGQSCFVYSAHSATLNWTASTTPNVTYNVYRATASGGTYTVVNSSPISGTTFQDTSVQPGQTYYYVARAVNANSVESVNSSPAVQATIPTP